MSNGHKARILIVDDDRMVRFVLHDGISRLGNGYEVETAADAEEALAKYGADGFDLLITDLKLPGMSGVELTQAVRAASKGTPIIWISAYASAETDRQASELAVYRTLDKPLEISQIRQAALAALEEQRPARASDT